MFNSAINSRKASNRLVVALQSMVLKPNRRYKDKARITSKMFDKGPATATSALPHFLKRKL